MSTITIKNLTFAYDGQLKPLFDQAQLNLDTTWHLGLVGRNGRGKTTLFKLLQNQLPYTGTISVPVSLQYFPQPVTDPTQLTLFVAQAIAPVEQWELERELSQLNVDLDVLWRPFVELSGGEQTKVLLSLLFLNHNDFALIDEPTNHLDQSGRAIVADYLKRQSGYMVISHDQNFLDQVTDHILAIEKQRLALYAGNYTVYTTEKANQDAFETAKNDHLKRDINRLETTAKEKAGWSAAREGDKYGDRHVKGSGGIPDKGFIGARAARVMQKKKNLEHRMDKEISDKSQLLKNIETIAPLTMTPAPVRHPLLAQLAHFSVAIDHQLFEPIDLQVRPGDRIAITGDNGVGKSSLLQALIGHWTNTSSGELIMPQLTISQVRQHYPDNTGLLTDFAEQRGLDYAALLNNLRKLGVDRDVFTTPIESMSMGQQKKVELAQSLVTPAELYLWDEPLNYLDTYNQDQLVTLLTSTQPTIIFIEHDQHFIDQVATKVIHLTKPA